MRGSFDPSGSEKQMTSTASQTTLRITLLHSPIGTTFRHKATLQALGLRKIRQSVDQVDTPQLRGMLSKVRHLVQVEEVAAAARKEKSK
jgi:large subunit ribosomal protein L30